MLYSYIIQLRYIKTELHELLKEGVFMIETGYDALKTSCLQK